MTIGFIAAIAMAQEDWPKSAELRPGEVVRVYDRTMSRQGQFDKVIVFTAKKVFLKSPEVHSWAMLTPTQQGELKSILAQDPEGLRAKKRPNPMWPSAYDGSDRWMSYRLHKMIGSWTNRDYEEPSTGDCPLFQFIESVRSQLVSSAK